MQDLSEEVIRRAAAGDISAFEAVFRTYSDYVFNIALRTTRNHEDAQEITQDVFIALYNKLSGFKFQSGLKTWLYRITVNMTINYLKKESKHRNNTVEYDDALGGLYTRPGVRGQADQEHQEYIVHKLLDGLSPEQKECVVLRNIEGFTYEEIAQALSIDINAVRSRLKRAREKLISLRKEVTAYEL